MSRARFSAAGLLSTTAAVAVIAVSAPAYAQTEAADASTGEAETIVVTGSRIARPNLEGASPVTVINNAEVKLTGTTRVEDLVNNLPQAFAAQGGGVSNGSTGTATVNLRGIGAARTLVLINGRRLVPGDPTVPVPDLNAIPAALIERVDVLTGGASSIYGADAVAGVVNFVMDTDFEGFRVDTQYSFFQHENSGDQRAIDALQARNFAFPQGNTVGGGQFDGTLTFGVGTDDGRGHLTAYAGYRKIKAVLQEDFDFTACTLQGSTTADAFSCGGSGTTAPAQIQVFSGRLEDPSTVQIDADPATPGNQSFTPNPTAAGAFRPYVGGRDAFNFGPYNYFQRPDERFTLGAFAEYEVNELFTPYMELSFMDDRTKAQLAPSGAFGVVANIDCANPLLSAAQRAAICPGAGQTEATLIVLRRNVEGGGRLDDLRHTNYRIVAGFKGDLSDNWSYDMYGQFGRTIFSRTFFNDFSVSRLQRAFDVVRDPATGAPVCRSVVDGTDPNCVPYNVFTTSTSIQGSATQGVTQAALDYLQTPAFANGQTTEQVLSLSVSGDLGFTSPFAEDGVGLALGAEYRKEGLEFNTDTTFSTGDLSGQSGATIGLTGGFDVKEVFGEVRVPLVQDAPFFDELNLEASYRYSDYQTNGASSSNSFSTDTYKVGLDWSPIDDVRFRGSYSRAIRAPNVVELFTAQAIGLFAGNDPCAGVTPAFTLTQCQRTGVSAAQYGNITENTANQYNSFNGGNPNLDPETADTWTAGVVLTPKGLLSGFTAAIDYFDIKVDNLIGVVGAQLVLNQCGLTGAAVFCDAVRRGVGTGSLYLNASGNPFTGSGFVRDLNTNIGGLRTKGVDVALDYRMDVGDGGLAFNLVGTYLHSLRTNPGVPVTVGNETFTSYDCKGYFGISCGVPAPEWRHKFRVTYTAPSVFSASLNWRYVGKVRDEQTQDNPYLAGGDFLANTELKAQNYFDLALTADVTEMATFRLGVNNILDNDPPLVSQQSLSETLGNGNTYPQVYDALGRYIYVGATFNF